MVPGLQHDVLALGCRNDAAGADRCADDRPLQTTHDAADDRADGAAGANGLRLVTNAAALEYLHCQRAHRVRPSPHDCLIEGERELAGAVDVASLVDALDNAAHGRSCGNQHAVPLHDVDCCGRFEPLFGGGGVGAQPLLETDVEFLSNRYQSAPSALDLSRLARVRRGCGAGCADRCRRGRIIAHGVTARDTPDERHRRKNCLHVHFSLPAQGTQVLFLQLWSDPGLTPV